MVAAMTMSASPPGAFGGLSPSSTSSSSFLGVEFGSIKFRLKLSHPAKAIMRAHNNGRDSKGKSVLDSGKEVLHPESTRPAREGDTPVQDKNTLKAVQIFEALDTWLPIVFFPCQLMSINLDKASALYRPLWCIMVFCEIFFFIANAMFVRGRIPSIIRAVTAFTTPRGRS